MPERFNSPEFDQPEVFISEKEQAILDSLSQEQKDLIKSLHTNSLTKSKADIVSIRSEDLFYFMECVKRGYFDLSHGEIIAKGDGQNEFFMFHNPEYKNAKDYPDNFKKDEVVDNHTFILAAEYNNSLYKKIAVIQGIYRNIIQEGMTSGIDEMVRGHAENYPKSSVADFGVLPSAREEFYDRLYRELLEQDPNMIALNRPRSWPILNTFSNHIKPEFKEQAMQILSQITNRESITIAFNEKILEYDIKPNSEGSADMPAEIIARSPDGKIPIDTVLGFETLGDYEDEVIKKL